MDAAACQALLQGELTMKTTQNQLADLVTEELLRMVENGELDEGFLDKLRMKASGAGEKMRGMKKAAGQSAKARFAGARGKVVKKLGGSAADLEGEAETQRQAAQATKAGSQQAVKVAQAKKLLGIKVQQISNLKNSMHGDAKNF